VTSNDYKVPKDASLEEQQVYNGLTREIEGVIEKIDALSAHYHSYSPMKKRWSFSTTLKSNAVKYKEMFTTEMNRLEELIKQLLATLSFRVHADMQYVKKDLANIQRELSQNFETVEDIKMRADLIKEAVDEVSMQLIDLNDKITTQFDKLNQHIDLLLENMPQSVDNKTVKSLKVVILVDIVSMSLCYPLLLLLLLLLLFIHVYVKILIFIGAHAINYDAVYRSTGQRRGAFEESHVRSILYQVW
jgi:hypothetical protein